MRLPKECDAVLTVGHRVVEGDPVKQILAVAAEIKCDLIALGTQGQTGLLSHWFGSGRVTEEIVRRALCSVLVTKTDAPAETPAAANTG